jgi:drug/metabolite transporter (DMT)-like permease
MGDRVTNETGRRHPISARAQLALGMPTFGSATPISKIVTGVMPVFIGSGLRVAIGALALAPFALRDPKRLARLKRRDWLFTGVIALFGMFGFTSHVV